MTTGVHELPPNKHMQRAVNDKVLGRGRVGFVHQQVCGARVLTGRRAGADVNRWAAQARSAVVTDAFC
jgi:hypothetical protein